MNDPLDKQFRSLRRYNDLKAEIERLIDSLLTPVTRDSEKDVSCPFDLYIEENNLVVEMEVPGLEQHQIQIEGMDKFLEISGEKDTVKRKYKSCLGLERTNGKFKKIIYIEHSVNFQEARATLREGILTIRMPLVVEKRGKKTIPLED